MKLSSVHAELHIFANAPNYGAPLRIELRFDDGTHLRLRVGGDGEGMVLDRLPLEAPFDMGEYGRTGHSDITDRHFTALKGMAIEALRSIDTAYGKRVGLALCGGDERFCFWVDGDEFHWGKAAALAGNPWLPEQSPAIGDEIAL